MKKIVTAGVCLGSVLMFFFASLNVYAEDMDGQSLELLNAINALQLPPVETLPIEEVRRQAETKARISDHDLKEIEETKILGPNGEIPVRIYIPNGKGPFPVFVTFHGGGWALGSLNLHEPFCTSIAEQAKVVVVSVDYRLAPKHKFPKPILDCYAAVEWASNNIDKYNGDPSRIAVSGHNSGGNLAAAVTLMAKDRGGPRIDYQVLVYPVTNLAFDTHSYQQYGQGFCLTKKTMKWFWSLYLNHTQEGKNPYASPLQCVDTSNLPAAMIVLADFDPLYDDGIQYADKLQKSGVSVLIKTYPTFHGFVSMSDKLEIGQQAINDIARQLRRVFK